MHLKFYVYFTMSELNVALTSCCGVYQRTSWDDVQATFPLLIYNDDVCMYKYPFDVLNSALQPCTNSATPFDVLNSLYV